MVDKIAYTAETRAESPDVAWRSPIFMTGMLFFFFIFQTVIFIWHFRNDICLVHLNTYAEKILFIQNKYISRIIFNYVYHNHRWSHSLFLSC